MMILGYIALAIPAIILLIICITSASEGFKPERPRVFVYALNEYMITDICDILREKGYDPVPVDTVSADRERINVEKLSDPYMIYAFMADEHSLYSVIVDHLGMYRLPTDGTIRNAGTL